MSYKCSNCGAVSLKWSGVCSNCNLWETLEEFETSNGKSKTANLGKGLKRAKVSSLSKVKGSGKGALGEVSGKKSRDNISNRQSTGISEFDRVLGGGLMSGVAIVLGGRPGIGKSTMLSQVANITANTGKVLYVAGEESPVQLRGRFDRLFGGSENLAGIDITEERTVEALEDLVMDGDYDLVIVDSIQSVQSVNNSGYPGGIAQVRTAGAYLVNLAKRSGVPFIIVGQINKDGVIAGPKVLEHAVDAVLYLEGDENGMYRVLSCIKNRFGSTDEIGVFEMTESGLETVENPSSVFLSSVGDNAPGSVLSAVMRGSRVVMVEVQALVVERYGGGGPMRRVANGIKNPRLEMLVAILSKYGGLNLSEKDVFVNVVGGFSVSDTSIDLAVCQAIRSSYYDKPVHDSSVYIGEVGLTGGVRSFYGVNRVVKELGRLGYKEVYLPEVGKSVKGLKQVAIPRITKKG